jgi:uncharacterized protein YceK
LKKWLILLLAVAALLPIGCGSVCNLASSEPANYGGVQKDIEWMSAMPDKPLFGSEYHGTDAWTFAFVLACIPTEFVLSFTLDTLALPYTVHRSHKNHPDDDRPALQSKPIETVVQVPSVE